MRNIFDRSDARCARRCSWPPPYDALARRARVQNVLKVELPGRIPTDLLDDPHHGADAGRERHRGLRVRVQQIRIASTIDALGPVPRRVREPERQELGHEKDLRERHEQRDESMLPDP